jgi:hypothetical protein
MWCATETAHLAAGEREAAPSVATLAKPHRERHASRMSFPGALDTPRSAPRSARWRHPVVIIALVALVASVAAFGRSLRGHFQGDDFAYVERFYALPIAQWPALFVQSWAGDIWGIPVRELRPITALSFMVDGRIWGGNAFGFRATNLALHVACATLVGALAWRAAGRRAVVGMSAALLFALHPVHAEPVQWITGRVDTLATLFYLAGFAAFVRFRETGARRWLVAFGGSYACAAFTKEFGLTLPVMCLVADLLWLRRDAEWRAWRTWAPLLVAGAFVVLYYLCRRAAFGVSGVGAPLPTLTDVSFQQQIAQRQLTYLGHLLPPAGRWWHEAAPALAPDRVRGVLGLTLLVVGLAAAVVVWLRRQVAPSTRCAGIFFALGWYLVATLPLVVTYISPRHLYLASAGVCVAVALGLQALLRRSVAVGIATAALAGFFVPRLTETMRPWHEAAVISGHVNDALRELEPHLRPGGALLIDVPEIHDGAYVWTWAVPAVLRPPFMRERWDDRVLAVASRGNTQDSEHWPDFPTFKRLQAATAPSWILHHSNQKPQLRIPVRPERLPPAVERFLAAPLKEKPHESWRQLIDDLARP